MTSWNAADVEPYNTIMINDVLNKILAVSNVIRCITVTIYSDAIWEY